MDENWIIDKEELERFKPPIDDVKRGLYTDKYFVRTREILMKDGNNARVLMQVFCKKRAILCGMLEALSLLYYCADDVKKLNIMALEDGSKIEPWETVLTIEGEYFRFCYLETLFLGVIARGTAVATSVREVVDVANGKTILFFSARFDHYLTQKSDGYAALIGGADGVSTDMNARLWDSEGIGTIPHGLIACYAGDTIKAGLAFDKYMPENVKRIVLVDWDNDCIKTALEVARVMGERLWGVRFDTAENLRDKSVTPIGKESLGVCPELVWKARDAFDRAGFKNLKIVVSGGFDRDKVKLFEELGVPVDAYGIGSSFFRKRIDFTADVVKYEGRHCAKVGRKFRPNPRLKKVIFND